MGEKEIHEAFLGMMQEMGVDKIEAIAEPALAEAEIHNPAFAAYNAAEAALVAEEQAQVKQLSEVTHYRKKAQKALNGKAGMTEQEKLDCLEKAAHCIAKAIAAQKAKMEAGE